MSDDREIDNLLDRLLADVPHRAPDRLLDRTLEIVARTPQRRAFAAPWQRRLVALPVRLALAAAVIVVVAVGGLIIASRSSTSVVGGSVAPLPIGRGAGDTANLQGALDACVPGGPSCIVQLRAGTYLTRQLVANGFHGTIIGAGQNKTIIQALPGYVVGSNVWTEPASPSNPWPYIMTFARDSDVMMADLTLRATEYNPAQQWNDSYSSGGTPVATPVTWLEGAVFVEGSGRFFRVSFEGAAGTGGGLDTVASGTAGTDLDSGVRIDEASAPAGVFEMTGCRAQNIGNAFVLTHFTGRATIGGSPATGNTFVNADGGEYFDLDGATIQESYNSVQADATSGGFWADWFGNDTAASHPSTVVLTNNTIAVNGKNFSGIGVLLNYNAAPSTPRDTMLHLTVAHNTVTIGGDGTDYAIYAQDTTEIVISDNTISGAGTDGIHLKDSVDSTVSANNLTNFAIGYSVGTSPRAKIVLEAGVTHARVTCASPSDTVLDQGTSNRVTGCTTAP